jgi:ABC-type uncharacterized transport system substrate-binding protein
MVLTRRGLMLGTASAMATGLTALPWRTAAAAGNAGLLPRLTAERRWRIGYAETMPYGNYAATLAGVVRELESLSWLNGTDKLPYTAGQTDSATPWRWLAERDLGPNMQFVGDAWYGGLDQASAEPILQRLESSGDLDLMIVMGTIAGQKLASDRHRVPTLVFSASNAVAAKIITSVEDSGHDHIWAHVDPQRFQRQVQIFHETFHFTRLGVAFEDSPSGRAIASIKDVEATAGRLGCTLVERHVQAPAGADDVERYYRDVEKAWGELSREVEAMYITYGRWTPGRFARLVRVFQDLNIPTFSQLGPEEVSRGVLMSVARGGFEGIGHFGASVIARLANGEPLRWLPQLYFDTPTIAWNLGVAAKMNFRPALAALLAADDIYTSINTAP